MPAPLATARPIYRVILPSTVTPHQQLAAKTSCGRIVLFRAPSHARPGDTIHVALPVAAKPEEFVNVRVPLGWREGQKLISAGLGSCGRRLMVTVPPGTQVGSLLRVVIPQQPARPQRFRVPEGHTPGHKVSFTAPDGVEHRVNLPADASPGATIEVLVGGGVEDSRRGAAASSPSPTSPPHPTYASSPTTSVAAPAPTAASRPALDAMLAATHDQHVHDHGRPWPAAGASDDELCFAFDGLTPVDAARAATQSLQLLDDVAAALAVGDQLLTAEATDDAPTASRQSAQTHGCNYDDLSPVLTSTDAGRRVIDVLQYQQNRHV